MFTLLLNGHAGSGLGEILIAIAIGALAIVAWLFVRVYRRRPETWLRFLALLYIGLLLALLITSATLFSGAIILAAYLVIFSVPFAVILWIGEKVWNSRES